MVWNLCLQVAGFPHMLQCIVQCRQERQAPAPVRGSVQTWAVSLILLVLCKMVTTVLKKLSALEETDTLHSVSKGAWWVVWCATWLFLLIHWRPHVSKQDKDSNCLVSNLEENVLQSCGMVRFLCVSGMLPQAQDWLTCVVCLPYHTSASFFPL